MIFAWQSRDTAHSAQRHAKESAQDVSARGFERDDRTWRYTRRVLDRHTDDIDSCLEQLDDVSDALEELYAHVSEHQPVRRPGRNNPRASSDPNEDRPNWVRAHRYKPDTSQSKLPERLEDLQRLTD